MSVKLAKLRCPRCSKSLGIPRKLAGKTTPCPRCGASFSIADDLSKLLPIGATDAEEPISAQAADEAKPDEPPLALSVEKPSRFSPLVLVIVGVTIFTLLIIGVVVMVLPSTSTTSPTATSPQTPTEAAEEESEETSEPMEETPTPTDQETPKTTPEDNGAADAEPATEAKPDMAAEQKPPAVEAGVPMQ